jgi:hypothetical protein
MSVKMREKYEMSDEGNKFSPPLLIGLKTISLTLYHFLSLSFILMMMLNKLTEV